jgi:plastocyanin
MRFSRAWLAALVIAAALALPGGALAAKPEVTSAEPHPDLTTVHWTVPAGERVFALEAANSTATYGIGDQQGYFLAGNRTAYFLQQLTGIPESFHLPAGTNFVHVAAYPTSCPSVCALDFSDPFRVDVPATPLAPATASVDAGHVTVTWSLPAWLRADSVELATSPSFNTTVLRDASPSGSSPEHTFSVAVPTGTYYVRVSAHDPSGCPNDNAPTCARDFTPPAEVVVPSRAPVLKGAVQEGGAVIVGWLLPDGVENDFVEVATAPQVYESGPEKGAFLLENLVLFDDGIWYGQSYYTAPEPLPPGTYYVHVAGFTPDSCPTGDAPTCVEEYSSTARVTIPAPPAPPARAAVAASQPADTTTAFASVLAPARQRVDELFVRAAMGEKGTISASGTVSIAGSHRVYRLRPAAAKVAPGTAVKLHLGLTRKARRAVSRAIARHRLVRARITITARDRAGNAATEIRAVKLGR